MSQDVRSNILGFLCVSLPVSQKTLIGHLLCTARCTCPGEGETREAVCGLQAQVTQTGGRHINKTPMRATRRGRYKVLRDHSTG